MKRLSLAFLACLAVCQAGTVVTGPVYSANGEKITGSIRIAWPSFTSAGGRAVWAGSLTVIVVKGAFQVNLEPTDTAQPQFLYEVSGGFGKQFWAVPTSATPILAGSVLTSPAVLPASWMIPWQQMAQNGAAVGQCPTWNGSSWVPGNCGGGAAGGPRTWGQLLNSGTTWGTLGGN